MITPLSSLSTLNKSPKSFTSSALNSGALVGMILSVLFLSSSCDFKVGKSSDASGGDKPKDQQDPEKKEKQETVFPVKIGAFEKGTISSTLKVHATLEAVKRGEIYPEISGVIKKVLKREGDFVKANEVVVQLDDEELKLTEDTKKVLWDQALSRVKLAELSKKEQDQAVQTKELLRDKAQSEFEAHEKLFNAKNSELTGSVSKEQFDQKRYAYEEAKLSLTSAEVAAQKAELDYELSKQTARQSELDYHAAQLQVRRAQIKSPIDGSITLLDLKVGELMSSSKLAFNVSNNSHLEAKLYVPQKELQRLKVGQAVRIRSEVFSDRPEPFRGQIEVINSVVDSENGMIRVIVGIDDPEALTFLKPGMFINGEVVLETHEDALLAKKRWLLYENQDPVVYLAEEGRAKRYVVETGFTDRDLIEVLSLTDVQGNKLSPLPDDLALIIAGQNSLKPEAKIKDVDSANLEEPTGNNSNKENEGVKNSDQLTEADPTEKKKDSKDESEESSAKPTPVSSQVEAEEVPAVETASKEQEKPRGESSP